MGCRFCYSRITHSAPTSSAESSLQPHLQFVRDNAQDLATINWGTTENTVAEEWYELVSAIQDIAPHVVQALTTNGYLAHACRSDARRKDIFLRCVGDVDVSLDFCAPEPHNRFRGHPNAFAMAMETLELCQEHGIPRSLVVLACGETLFPENLDGLFRIAARYDAHVRLSILRPVRGCELPPLSYAQLRAGLAWITEHHDAVSLSDPLFAALAGCPTSDPTGIQSARILPNGDVTPCTYLIEPPWIAANIYQERVRLPELASRWAFRALREPVRPEPCRDCTLWSACGGGSKDRRILAGGSLATRDPYCPRLHDDELRWFTGRVPCMKKSAAPLVHAAYLSTLIFAHAASDI
jgi:radical SAM protein with 4Fe4S-binding SPASM domain